MKTLITVLLTSAALASVPARAQNDMAQPQPAASQPEAATEQPSQTDAAQSQAESICAQFAADRINGATRDLQAKYWAWRISQQKEWTYATVERDSAGWMMGPEARQAFLETLKTLVLAGSKEPLTQEEELRLDQTSRLLAVIFTDSNDPDLAKEKLTDSELIALNARATALMLKEQGNDGKDLELAGDFPQDFKKAIVKATRALLKEGKIVPLTRAEEKQLRTGNQIKTEEYAAAQKERKEKKTK